MADRAPASDQDRAARAYAGPAYGVQPNGQRLHEGTVPLFGPLAHGYDVLRRDGDLLREGRDDVGLDPHDHAVRAVLLGPGSPRLAVPARHQRVKGRDLTWEQALLGGLAPSRPYTSESERAASFAAFLHHHNHHRGHTALKGASPADRVPNLRGQNS